MAGVEAPHCRPLEAIQREPECEVLGPGLGRVGHHMLVVGPQEREVELNQFLPFFLFPQQCARCPYRGHRWPSGSWSPSPRLPHLQNGNRSSSPPTWGPDSRLPGRWLPPRLRSNLLGDLDRRPANSLSPEAPGILDLHLFIHDREPHRVDPPFPR